jgi:hypothetical protein
MLRELTDAIAELRSVPEVGEQHFAGIFDEMRTLSKEGQREAAQKLRRLANHRGETLAGIRSDRWVAETDRQKRIDAVFNEIGDQLQRILETEREMDLSRRRRDARYRQERRRQRLKASEQALEQMLESVDAALEQLMQGVDELPIDNFVDHKQRDQHYAASRKIRNGTCRLRAQHNDIRARLEERGVIAPKGERN